MRVAYIGNFEPEHSTENHLRRALNTNGHEVLEFQENQLSSWDRLTNEVGDCDFVLWTRTGWDPPIPYDKQHEVLDAANRAGKAVVGYHLDRWWGLNRQPQLFKEPFFCSDLVITADGGHQDQFAAAGINHHWMPPGVLGAECTRDPQERPELAHEVVFCGSWQSYHKEWSYRLQLVRWLKRAYKNRVVFYPKPGEHALRGQDLVDLYNNSKVMVGDSCLAGGQTHYWSDRVPETLGRGGFLIHPEVEGLEEHFKNGEHLVTYKLGDWRELQKLINQFIEDDEERQRIAASGRAHVLANHTYEVRMDQLVSMLREKGML